MSSAVTIVTSQARSVHSGVGTYARMLVRELVAAGLSSLRVATWREEQDRAGHPGCEWIDLGSRPRWDPTTGQFWSLGRRFAAWSGRQRWRAEDVVHFLDARDGYAFVQARPTPGPRAVGTVHDDYAALVGPSPGHYFGSAADPLRRWLFHRWLQAVERRAYPKFDALMVNSAATAATLCATYGLPAVRLRPVTLTIDAAASAPVLPLAGAPSLVFCGGNYYRKGLDTCLRALACLRDRLPLARLHVLGTCRSAATVRRLAHGLGVQRQVEFHGRVRPEQVAALLAGAQQFVMPSRTEALGLVYLEAFRAGVPVIAGDRGGVTEIVRDQVSGLAVPPADAVALAQAIERLHADPGLRQRLVRGGQEVLAERTPARLLAETLACYGVAAPTAAAGAQLACATGR